LEVDVEAERLDPAPPGAPSKLDWRNRIHLGARFERAVLRALKERDLSNQAPSFIAAFRTAFPVPDGNDLDHDPPARTFRRQFVGRVVDGGALLRAIEAGAGLPDVNPVPDEVRNAIAAAFLADHRRLFRQPDAAQGGGPHSQACNPETLQYRFGLAFKGPTYAGPRRRDTITRPPHPTDPSQFTQLEAPDYRSGELDWFTFSIDGEPRGTWHRRPAVSLTPTPVFVGGTSSRWWAFEDAATDFGAVEAGPTDLAKLALMEFVLAFSDDWFSVPLRVPTGSLVRIASLKVRDTFGKEKTLSSIRQATAERLAALGADPRDALLRWEVFTLSPFGPDATETPSPDVLFVPAAINERNESAPLEEVRFVRDEGANMVFGIEAIVQDGLGRPRDGSEAARARRATAGESEGDQRERRATDAPPLYKLATPAPDAWIPFIPVRLGRSETFPVGRLRLRRARILSNVDDDAPKHVPAQTRILSLDTADPLRWMQEAAIPRLGATVQLTAQRVRRSDGKTVVWLGRRVVSGRGERSSGLRFDVLGDLASDAQGDREP
jgi:hypothetical protein